MTAIKFGTTLPQFTSDPHRLVAAAQRAESLNLDSIWLFDHMWPLTGGKQRPILECWSTLGFVAAHTERIGIGTLVTRSSLRHPALVAKMAATIGEIAPGRLTVCIGSGDSLSRPENEAFGLPYFAGHHRIRQLVATIAAVRAALTQARVTIHDEYVSLEGLRTSPTPAVPPAVWVGGRSPPLLEAAGRIADGWNAWGTTPERFGADVAVVRAAAGERTVETSWAGLVVLANSSTDAAAKLAAHDPDEYLVGTPDRIGELLGAIGRAGAGHLVVTFRDSDAAGNYEFLADLKSA